MRTASGTGASNDVRSSVAVDVARTNEHASEKSRIVGENTLKQVQVCPIEDLHVRSASRPDPRDDVGIAITVHIAGCNVNAPQEKWRVSKKGANYVARIPIKYTHDRWSTTIWSDDDVRFAVSVNVAGCNKHSSAEECRKGQEAPDEPAASAGIASVKNFNMRSASRARTSNDVGHSVAINVTDSDAYPSHEIPCVSQKVNCVYSLARIDGDFHHRRMTRTRPSDNQYCCASCHADAQCGKQY